MKIRNICLFVFLTVLSGISGVCLAVSEGKGPSNKPGPAVDLVVEDVQPVDDQYRLYAYYAAAAFRENDFSFCADSKYPDKCAAQAGIFFTLSYLSKKNCTRIKDQIMGQVCEALQNRCRDAKSKGIESMCRAIQEKDAQLLFQTCRAPAVAYYGIFDKQTAEEMLNLYDGFLDNDVAACVKNTDNPYLKNVCTILFDPNFSIDSLPSLVANSREQFKKVLEKKYPGRYID